ncbi:MAG: hypothetical protein JWQ18_1568, partial [Conexibacter sp.]|nr:hypothetical protein [Conexibacter sp.]
AAVPDLAALAERARDDGSAPAAAAEMSMVEYAAAMPEPGIGPLRFDDFPFQTEWFSEEVAAAEEVVFAKSAQVGASAYAIRWAMRQADQFGDTGLYVMPSDAHVAEFGDERIEPAIEASEYLRTRILGKFVRSKRLKRIGHGFLHLRGSNSKAGAQSIAAQFIVFDEYDLLDQTNLPHIERRISGARQIGKRPRVRRLGYPMMVGSGIDAAWQSSDQRVWHVVCAACAEEQPLRWEENVRWTMPGHEGEVFRAGRDAYTDPKVVGDVWRCCRTCEASLEGAPLRTGRWIAQNPGVAVVGFHAWRGMVPTTDLAQLVVNSRGTSDQQRETFDVLDLGRPHTPESSGLTLQRLLAACQLGSPMAEGYAGGNAVTMGIDVAGERDLNVRVSEQLPAEQPGMPNPRRALWIGRAGDFNEIVRLIERFRPAVVAIDSNPERRMAKALRATYPGRVVLVEYGAGFDSPPLDLKMDDAGVPLIARVNRTDAIDGMMDAIRQQRNRPLHDPPAGYLDQMRALRRRTRIDSRGRPVRYYETTGSSGDDYAHAEVFDLVATELWRTFSGVQAQLSAAGAHHIPDEALGFRPVRLAVDDEGDYRPGFGTS